MLLVYDFDGGEVSAYSGNVSPIFPIPITFSLFLAIVVGIAMVLASGRLAPFPRRRYGVAFASILCAIMLVFSGCPESPTTSGGGGDDDGDEPAVVTFRASIQNSDDIVAVGKGSGVVVEVEGRMPVEGGAVTVER